MDGAEVEMEIIDPGAARKKVSPASPSGGNFMPSDATAENFNNFTLLKYLSLNQNTRALL